MRVSSLEKGSKWQTRCGNPGKRVISSLEKGSKCHSTGERLEKGSFLALKRVKNSEFLPNFRLFPSKRVISSLERGQKQGKRVKNMKKQQKMTKNSVFPCFYWKKWPQASFWKIGSFFPMYAPPFSKKPWKPARNRGKWKMRGKA